MLRAKEILPILVGLLCAAALVWLCTTLVSCARIGHPEGGPRDSLPPVLVRTQPLNGELYFSKKRVLVTFNEYVQLKEADKQFIMSPPPAKRPTLNVRGKSIRVDFNSPLPDSTTYLLDFGSSIVDNNEGNPYQQYQLMFSTGDHLDSLTIGGITLDAFTDKAYSGAGLLVFLYENNDDSVVLKQRPNAMMRPDAKGYFMAGALKSKPYKLVALADANKNYKYDIGQEAIAFLDVQAMPLPQSEQLLDTSELHKHDVKLMLRLFTEEFKTQYLTSCERPQKRALKLTFNAPFPTVDSITIDSQPAPMLVPEYSLRHDTITFWFADTATRVPDTMNLRFVYLKTDTLGELSPFAEKRRLIFTEKPKKEDEKKGKSGGLGGLLNRITGNEEEVDTTPKKPAHWTLKPTFGTAAVSPIGSATLSFAALPIALNAELIRVEEMSINPRSKDTSYLNVDYTLVRDSLNLRYYRMEAAWKEATVYRYMMLPTAFWDVYAQTNDTMKGTFTSVDPDKLAKLTLHITNAASPYVVQLTDAKGATVVRQFAASGDQQIDFIYVPAGTYGIRIIKDENGNGKWDTGSYWKRLQPEYATFLRPAPDKENVELKVGWDLELSVDMTVIFPERNDI
ncbi:MAG: Ig-like domain-containing protein [Prevotellaceae bacterium]|jgi:hypothetical protein|nr:Ig-like domain-containing protein [Prevotellaceae bacterium]